MLVYQRVSSLNPTWQGKMREGFFSHNHTSVKMSSKTDKNTEILTIALTTRMDIMD